MIHFADGKSDDESEQNVVTERSRKVKKISNDKYAVEDRMCPIQEYLLVVDGVRLVSNSILNEIFSCYRQVFVRNL